MENKVKLVKRKHTRLKCYDYSNNGYYFVTICSNQMKNIFSKIYPDNVGRGLAPAEKRYGDTIVRLTKIGKIIEEQLLDIENRFDFVKIDEYVIMPNHIHFVIIFQGKTAGASPRPTLTDVICTFKSLTTIKCNKVDNMKGRKVFQTSFYEHVIRNENSYLNIWQYINENPRKWENDKYYI